MIRSLGALWVVTIILIAGCTGDDDAGPSASDRDSSDAPAASGHDVAFVVSELAEELDSSVQAAGPCIEAAADACAGDALAAYEKIDDAAGRFGAVLPTLSEESEALYLGELRGRLRHRVDRTIAAAADVEDASIAAQEACLPSFPPPCAAANDELRGVIDALGALVGDWRAEL